MDDLDLTGGGGITPQSLMSHFSLSELAAGLVFGVVGLYLLRYGRKHTHFPHIFIGLALMIYPYFVSGNFLTWGVGVALCGLAYYLQ